MLYPCFLRCREKTRRNGAFSRIVFPFSAGMYVFSDIPRAFRPVASAYFMPFFNGQGGANATLLCNGAERLPNEPPCDTMTDMTEIKRKGKYPIILVHGIMIKDIKFFKAFGRIEKVLKSEGYRVQTGATDGFGTIEHNAQQLKKEVERVLRESGAEKVNLIAHSKGGLDAVFMIERLGMEDCVASLTTLCTPHRGSQIASKILRLPVPVTKFIAFWLNFWYRVFGDKKPDALTVCKQLQSRPDVEEQVIGFSEKVYCQSYSATLQKSRDDFVMGIPLIFSKRFEPEPTDGLVSVPSAKFGNYRGDCVEGSVSHTEIVDFMARKKKKEKIYAFWLQLCDELTALGF